MDLSGGRPAGGVHSHAALRGASQRASERVPLSSAPYTVVLLDDAHQRAVLKTVGAPAADAAFSLACAAYRAEMGSDDAGFDHAAFMENVECIAVFAGAHPSLFALHKRAEE